jgi:hypothetical protein
LEPGLLDHYRASIALPLVSLLFEACSTLLKKILETLASNIKLREVLRKSALLEGESLDDCIHNVWNNVKILGTHFYVSKPFD